MYPELESSAEYHFKRLHKIVRYLKPNNDDFFANLPCNDLIFIKYEKDATLVCNRISKIDAFKWFCRNIAICASRCTRNSKIPSIDGNSVRPDAILGGRFTYLVPA